MFNRFLRSVGYEGYSSADTPNKLRNWTNAGFVLFSGSVDATTDTTNEYNMVELDLNFMVVVVLLESHRLEQEMVEQVSQSRFHTYTGVLEVTLEMRPIVAEDGLVAGWAYIIKYVTKNSKNGVELNSKESELNSCCKSSRKRSCLCWFKKFTRSNWFSDNIIF